MKNVMDAQGSRLLGDGSFLHPGQMIKWMDLRVSPILYTMLKWMDLRVSPILRTLFDRCDI